MTNEQYLKCLELNQRIGNIYHAIIAIEDGTISLEKKTKKDTLSILYKQVQELEEKLDQFIFSKGS